MASPVPQPSVPEPAAVSPPAADPVAIRACLPPDVAAVFDAEWEHVLDEAKQSKDLLAGELEVLIRRINVTNLATEIEPGVTVTDGLARAEGPARSHRAAPHGAHQHRAQHIAQHHVLTRLLDEGG